MKTWSSAIIRNAIKFPHLLLEKRIVCIFENEEYMNGYEYGIFTNIELCYRLAACMHAQGFLISDTVTPFVMNLAMISDNVHNYAALGKIKWNEKTFQGIMKRPDRADLLLRQDYDINGFEFGIRFLPKFIGKIIQNYGYKISDVISYDQFKNCERIKDIFV